MPKNITVVDDEGHTYQPTYPKRAKGLVKRGRARWLEEHCICLTVPPAHGEEKPMSNILPVSPTDSRDQGILSKISEIISLLSEIQRDKNVYDDALYTLRDMKIVDPVECGAPLNVGAQARADAIGRVAEDYGKTRRQLIAFYWKIYEDMMVLHGLRTKPSAPPQEDEIPAIPEMVLHGLRTKPSAPPQEDMEEMDG